MADPMDTKFKFEVKQDDQKPERKSTKLFGPGDSNVFKKALHDATKGSVGNQGKQPAPVEMEQLHAIYISSVPEDILDKDLLMEHFSQFGKVKRVYISNVRMSAIIHFENHEVANQAKMSGALLQGHKLDIFWSKSAKVYSPVPKKSPQSSPERATTSEKQNMSPPTARATPAKVVEKQAWKVAGHSSSVTSKYTLSEEVKEELISMSGGDITKYQERPHSLTGSTAMQALQKQKALALTRVGVRGGGSTTKRSSLGVPGRSPTYGEEAPPLPLPSQVAKPKARTVPRARAKSTDQSSCAESLFALTKKQALTAEDRYNILESRDKILRKLQSKGVMKRSPLAGTCRDMCPEKERYHREITNQVAVYELLSSTEEVKMDHERAVKQYSRSSANQDDTLCHELRPALVLVRTMNYLLAHVMNRFGRDSNVHDWFHYLWDRTRSIRKDITQQELCDHHCVSLLEQCARFHIHCAEQLVSEDPAVFDQKINTENLTKSLQTLKYMYDDMALKGESCPCEAEFRAYMVLLNLNDSNFIWDLKQVRHEILRSSEVQFSLRIHTAIHSHNFVRFFKLVRQTTYLNACLLQRYFCQVRTSALLMVCKACCPGRTRIWFPVLKLMKLLAFESVAETCEFLGCCGLTEYDAENKKCVAMWKGAVSVPQPPPQTYRAPNLIESKMASSLSEVVYGCSQPIGASEIQSVYSSFDEKGYLKTEALCISDIRDSGVFRVPAGESVPKRKKTSPVAVKSFKLGESSDVKLGSKELASPDAPSQLQHPASSSRLGVVKPINYSFASVGGNVAPNAAHAEPVFSFKLTGSREGSAVMSSAAMDVDVTSSVCSTATEIGGSPSDSKARPSTRATTTTRRGASTPETVALEEPPDATPPCRHVPTTPPFSPLQEIKPHIPGSKMQLPFVSFDRSKSATTSTQVPFVWKRKPTQDDGGKEENAYSLETMKSNIGFSVSSPFFKKEQFTNRGRFGEEPDENAAAVRKQQEADELKKRIRAEEQKRLEEEKRRVAAEKEILMSQRAQQVLEVLVAEVTLDTCSVILKEVQLAARAKEFLDEILNSVVTENSKVLLDEAVHNRRLSLLVEKVKHRKIQVVCDKWRLFTARCKKRRKTAENFPPLTLLLNSPSDLYVPSPAQIGTVHLTDYSKYLEDVTFSKLDTCALVGRRMLMRMTALGWNSPDIFWKLVVSVPDSEESVYEQEASLWVHQMFTGKQHVKSHPKVVTVRNTNVIYSDIQLVSCVACVAGCASEEASCGMNGMLLWIPSSTDDWPGVRRRLRHCVVGKARLPPVPVAVLLVRNMGRLLAGEVARRIGLEDLVSEGYISEYNVEMPSCNSMQAIREAVVKAVCWLSERAPDPRPVVVRPLQHLLDDLVHGAFKQITFTVKDTIFASGVVESPNNIIYLYNKVLCMLQDCLTDPQLAEFSKGAPEFKALTSEYEHLLTCLEDCGTPRYCRTISQVMKKAELSPIRPWPPASVHELVQILERYCRSNDLLDHWPLYNYLECAVVEYFEHGEVPNSNSEWLEFLQSVNWTEVVQIIVSKKLESLQMLSTSTEHMQVAISKQNLSSFMDNFWWFTSEEINTVVETPFRMSNSDKRKAAGEPAGKQASEKKRRSAPGGGTSGSCIKRHYKEMTREIDASLRALKSLNEDITKMMLGNEHA